MMMMFIIFLSWGRTNRHTMNKEKTTIRHVVCDKGKSMQENSRSSDVCVNDKLYMSEWQGQSPGKIQEITETQDIIQLHLRDKIMQCYRIVVLFRPLNTLPALNYRVGSLCIPVISLSMCLVILLIHWHIFMLSSCMLCWTFLPFMSSHRNVFFWRVYWSFSNSHIPNTEFVFQGFSYLLRCGL